MKKTLLFLLLAASVAGIQAQNHDAVITGKAASQVYSGAEMVRYGFLSSPDFVKFRTGSELTREQLPKVLEKTLKMRPQDGLETLKEEKDDIGMSHIRMQQVYHGIPVMGGVYYAHIKDNKVTSMNGDFVPVLNIPSVPLVTREAALANALKFVNAEEYRWENASDERWIKWNEGDVNATFYPVAEPMVAAVEGNTMGGDFRLTWRFDIYSRKPWARQYIYVDAVTGEVIWSQNRIHTADVAGTGLTKYSGPRNIVADYTGSYYRLREVGRGGGVSTYDLNQGTDYFAAVDFTDADNTWNNINPEQDETATDAHWGSEMTYDFFYLTYARNSIDGAGFPINSYIHYDFGFNNAFWDGTQMTYGDGDGFSFTPFQGLDVCGHEITHGLTEHSAALVYSGQSGALNESFSDIFGNVVEHYARPTDYNWLIGEDITTASGGGAIRSMSNPNAYNCPDTYMGTMWDTWEEVHTNSGVQNKWFFILTDGETGTNDNGDSYSVTGLGWTKSSAIAFRNLTVYLTPSSDYSDARFYAIQSATDLYGGCTAEVEATTNAWYAVGVGGIYVPYTVADFEAIPFSFCDVPAVVNFSNLSVNGITYTWNFGDGGTSTLTNPTHTYTLPGNYTVTLTADGGACGKDTLVLTSYIVVDTTLSCDIVMTPGSTTTLGNCSGTLYDSGGPSGNYLTNEISTVVIAPPSASSVSVQFTSFEMEDGWDFVYVYDGPSTAGPLLGVFTGYMLPVGGGVITASSGVMTIQLTADFSYEYSGFAANFSCVELVNKDTRSTLDAAKVYPNPFADVIDIEMNLAQAGDVTITALDPLGREVVPVWSGRAGAGAFHQRWSPGADLPAGTWFLCIDVAGEKVYKKVVHLH